jgi:hypothetical protein
MRNLESASQGLWGGGLRHQELRRDNTSMPCVSLDKIQSCESISGQNGSKYMYAGI